MFKSPYFKLGEQQESLSSGEIEKLTLETYLLDCWMLQAQIQRRWEDGEREKARQARASNRQMINWTYSYDSFHNIIYEIYSGRERERRDKEKEQYKMR